MLHCYGENSFTFLLFQELNKSPEKFELFISNLKNFRSGQKFNLEKIDTTQDSEPQIWLFPNFGKRHGFGEPDVLILYGGHTFWFEVETNFDLIKRKSSARSALIQLLRFYYLNKTLARGTKRRVYGTNHLALMGPTITGKGKVKDGILRVANHPVLKGKTKKLLREAALDNRDHYILLSDQRMRGITKTDIKNNQKAINSLFTETSDEVHQQIESANKVLKKPSVDRFWYSYFNNDLSKHDISLKNSKTKYVPIKSK